MNPTQQKVLNEVRRVPGQTCDDIARALGMQDSQVYRALAYLRTHEYIRVVNGSHPLHYECTELVAEDVPVKVPNVVKDKKAMMAFLKEYKRLAAENQQLRREIRDLQGFLNRFAGAMRKGRVYPSNGHKEED